MGRQRRPATQEIVECHAAGAVTQTGRSGFAWRKFSKFDRVRLDRVGAQNDKRCQHCFHAQKVPSITVDCALAIGSRQKNPENCVPHKSPILGGTLADAGQVTEI
jgi:hypothetical protein